MKKEISKISRTDNMQIIHNTPERVASAAELDKIVTGKLWDFMLALKEINDNKYYIELGYDTLQGYCIYKLDMAYGSAMRYIRIAEKYSFFRETDSSVSSKTGQFSHVKNQIFEIDAVKLDSIGRLPDSKIEQFKQTGKLQLGKEKFTLEDIKAMKREELARIVGYYLGETPKAVAKPERTLMTNEEKIQTGFRTLMMGLEGYYQAKGYEDDVAKRLGELFKDAIELIEKNICKIKTKKS